MSPITSELNTPSKGADSGRAAVGPVGPGGSSITPSATLRLSVGQQPGRCRQGVGTHGAVGEGLSGPGDASATPPATPLTPVDPPCRNSRGSVSSRVRFFEEGGGTAAIPVDPSTSGEIRGTPDPMSASILAPLGAVPKPTSQPVPNQRKKRRHRRGKGKGKALVTKNGGK